jgi:endo-1,4-beta-mannosidase
MKTVQPKDKKAFEYVKNHLTMPFSDEEFLIVESFFAEYLDSLYPDGLVGDGDTKNFIYRKLEETDQLIPQQRVDAIADALYEYAFENNILLPENEQTIDIVLDLGNATKEDLERFLSK